MNNIKEKKLSDNVRIARQYQRSIRVDTDIGRPDALNGYICHGSAKTVLDSMSKQIIESNQRGFTWTGPFGGGKSSLAVALGSALVPEKSIRLIARSILKIYSDSDFDKAFPVKNGWLVIPLVGKRSSVVEELSTKYRKVRGIKASTRKITSNSLIEEICSGSMDLDYDGILIVIDEMGKFLEASALGVGDDIYFFQELAEAAARAGGKIVVIGILHQSFGQYAARLGIDTRDDWSKVQGRYSDIPLVAASDEVVELVGNAIEVDNRPDWMPGIAAAIARSIQTHRVAVGDKFANDLEKCWPLHPAMAALLGPISKRQFSQNERSTFGFLASVEPHGFKSFLQSTPLSTAVCYRPDNYWDYLRSNLEPAILASPDGHRWAQAVEAVERTEAKSNDPLQVSLIKNIAIIDLFRNGSGLVAEVSVLSALMRGQSVAKIEETLKQLSVWRVALYKKHIGAWSIFEGSDFDIESAVAQARAVLPGVDFELLSGLANLYPVLAKRHYHETGTMRWMSMALCRSDGVEQLANTYKPKNGEFGLFVLALPQRGANSKALQQQCLKSSRAMPWPIAVGIPNNYLKIEDLGIELLALQNVQVRHELAGDQVARREVVARITSVCANLEEQLRAAVIHSRWSVGSTEFESGKRLSPIASDLADNVYKDAPGIWSELVNRDNLSGNSVKARRDLLYRMLDHEDEKDLGIDGFPAERGLYETLLKTSELHRFSADGIWCFMPPDTIHATKFISIWNATKALLGNSITRVSISEIHDLWSAPPFGLRNGIKPILMTVFLLAHKGNIAVYKDGIFIPHLNDADIDEYIQDVRRFSLRWIVIDQDKSNILTGISKILTELGVSANARDPLDAARSLVALVLGLPAWCQRTHRLSPEARAVRDTLLRAHDPHKVLFVDLPAVLQSVEGNYYVNALRAPLTEIAGAYAALLERIETSMLNALDARRNELDHLRARAVAVTGITGDLRQDAFAARLAKHDGSQDSVAGILSLAANKPPREWNDRDIDLAQLEISQAALRFRQAEAFVSVRGRKPTSEAFAIVIGAGADTKTMTRSFAISDRYSKVVESMAEDLTVKLKSEGLNTNILLAILARTGMRLAIEDSLREDVNHG